MKYRRIRRANLRDRNARHGERAAGGAHFDGMQSFGQEVCPDGGARECSALHQAIHLQHGAGAGLVGGGNHKIPARRRQDVPIEPTARAADGAGAGVGVYQPLVVRGGQHIGHGDAIDGIQRQRSVVDIHRLRQRIIAGVDGVVIGPGFVGAEHVVTAAAPGKGVDGI